MGEGDSVYGADHAIRRWAERHRRGYVLAVTSGQRLGARPVTTWIADLPKTAWQRLSAGEGAKGPRLYDWAYGPYAGGAAGFRCGLLVRRSLDEPMKLTFYLTQAPAGTTLADLARVAGCRWTIASCFEQAKGEVGLDHYEVRSWIGWHRHITLAMLALAYLAVSARRQSGGTDPLDLAADLLPLTLPEVRRLLRALVGAQPPRPSAALHWSTWRRRHQQRARRAHWRARTTRKSRL